MAPYDVIDCLVEELLHSSLPHSHFHYSWILSALISRASEGSFLNLEATAQVPLPPQKVGGPTRPPNTRESHALTYTC